MCRVLAHGLQAYLKSNSSEILKLVPSNVWSKRSLRRALNLGQHEFSNLVKISLLPRQERSLNT